MEVAVAVAVVVLSIVGCVFLLGWNMRGDAERRKAEGQGVTDISRRDARRLMEILGDETAELSVARTRDKHDGLVSALRELQEKLEATEARAANARALLLEVLENDAEFDQANYWVNKVRDDDDFADAMRALQTAAEKHDDIIKRITKAVRPATE